MQRPVTELAIFRSQVRGTPSPTPNHYTTEPRDFWFCIVATTLNETPGYAGAL